MNHLRVFSGKEPVVRGERREANSPTPMRVEPGFIAGRRSGSPPDA